MNPELLVYIINGLQIAIKYAPGLATEIQAIFAKDTITDEDWQNLKIKINQSYFDLVPNSKLPHP